MKYQLIALALAVILLAGCTGAPKTAQNATIMATPLNVQCPNSTAQVGVPFASSISATGGSGIYHTSISGTLPYGMTSNGQLIKGTAAANTAGEYPYSVTVTDSANQSATSTCSLNVIQRIFQCTINGQAIALRYTMQDCTAACFNQPAYCAEFEAPKKSSNAWSTLMYIVVFIAFAFAAVIGLFPDVIAQHIKPENFELQKLRTLAKYKGKVYNIRTNEWEDHVTGEWGFTFEHSKRKGDGFPVSNFSHAYGLATNDRFQPYAEIIDLPVDYQKAKDDLKMVAAENKALRESHYRYLSTDVMGIAEGLSFKFKVVGENVHSVNVQPMNRGQDGIYRSGSPPQQE